MTIFLQQNPGTFSVQKFSSEVRLVTLTYYPYTTKIQLNKCERGVWEDKGEAMQILGEL